MSDPIPFARAQRRRARMFCETPGCSRPHLGPIGIAGQTPMVYPCHRHALELYGSADPFDIMLVLLGDAAFASRDELIATAFGREGPHPL